MLLPSATCPCQDGPSADPGSATFPADALIEPTAKELQMLARSRNTSTHERAKIRSGGRHPQLLGRQQIRPSWAFTHWANAEIQHFGLHALQAHVARHRGEKQKKSNPQVSWEQWFVSAVLLWTLRATASETPRSRLPSWRPLTKPRQETTKTLDRCTDRFVSDAASRPIKPWALTMTEHPKHRARMTTCHTGPEWTMPVSCSSWSTRLREVP